MPASLYKTADVLEKKIEGYLAQCEIKKELPNKAGACLFLNICKETYCAYRKDKIHSDAIKRLDRTIENAWVQRLKENASTGAIFYLKNAFKDEYRDRYESDMTTNGKDIVLNISEAIANKNGINRSAEPSS